MATKGSKPRKRAPRRDGERTTLRVPPDVAQATRDLASALGTTPNDALVLLARRGALFYVQELEMARHAERQWAAMLEAMGPPDPDAEYPPFEEARAAAMFLRGGG